MSGDDGREASMTDGLLERVRTFVHAEVLPRTDHLDSLPEAPTRESARLHEAGLANWWIPAAYGGQGVPLVDSVDIVSELAYGDAGFAFGSFLSILGTTMLQLCGDDELVREPLERLARDGGVCAILASEEEAGSELARISTTFRRDGDRLVLDGDKYFSTNADAAGLLLVVARDAEDAADFRVLLVPRDTPGVEIVKRWDMVGMRGSATYRLRLQDCSVPAAHTLRGNGLRNLEMGLNASRILIASTAIGVSRRVRDLCMEYAAVKQVKGARLADNAVFAGKLGQIEMLIDVMRHQCRAAAAEFDRYLSGAEPASALYRTGTLRSALAAKMYCGQAGWQVATTGSEMFGGLGYTHDHPVGKLVRDLRYVGLVEGGDDVVRDLLYTRFVVPAGKRR
ncbi:acyl-CoA dehydrogenase family protein [Streptomyces sp. ms115]|uniref:acyl-CoA dehydrogenase family protein n=1 Tax=Streptomyces sp. ms115 TaxID=1827928 RepID=UPI00211D3301|nr:acyl-CoA dehydrogenase family protein [Streptomyces sp. ms115]